MITATQYRAFSTATRQIELAHQVVITLTQPFCFDCQASKRKLHCERSISALKTDLTFFHFLV